MGDPDVNSDSLELWSFRVIYKQSADGEREVQGLEADLGGEETFESSLCVINLLDRVFAQCDILPQLPGEIHSGPTFIQLLANPTLKMTAIFNPVSCIRTMVGSQKATWKLSLSHLLKALQAGNPMRKT